MPRLADFSRLVRTSGMFALIALVLVHPLPAQVVRGTVVDATKRPLPGVVVSMLDSTDATVARALSSDAGEFRLVAPRGGTYRLRALRIGFQPTTTAPAALAPGTVNAETIVMDGVRVMLETMRIVERGSCGRQQASEGDNVFAAWDQAIASIAATSLTSSARGFSATTLQLERELMPDGRRIRSQTANVRTDVVRQPWRSLSPDSLRRNGYTSVDASGATTFYAPGLEVLVSPNFLEDHCLRLMAAERADEIGVAFEPTQARRSKSEIRGTLWLARQTAELRRLEFQFTERPNTTARIVDGSATAGGSMKFVRLDDGSIFISSWDIRMPLLERETPRSPTIRVAGIALSGGELVTIRRGSDTLYKRDPIQLRGTVKDSVSGRALPGAIVSLVGTPVSVTTDADGAFVVADVLPGEYTVAVRTPSLDSVRASSGANIVVTDGMPPLALRVPTATQLAMALCGGALSGAAGRSKGGVLGVVRQNNDSAGAANIRVVADWTETIVRSATVVKEGRRLESRTDASGAYRLCGVPTETVITVRAMPDSAKARSASVRLEPDQRFASVPLTIDRTQVATATLFGTVVSDSSFRPLADVDVAIPALGLSARSNARGEYRLTDVPPGTHEIMVRRVGFGVIVATLSLAANEEEERRMVMRPLTVLDSVEVVSTRIDPGLADFEANKKIGLGHFITRADLAKNDGRKMGDVMSMTPGAGVVRGRAGAWMMSKRFVVPLSATQGKGEGSTAIWKPSSADRNRGLVAGCYAQVYIDNKLMNPERPTEPYDINSIAPDQIEAVEWYASPAQTPSRYSNLNSVCGVLVIHTRRFDSIKKP